MTIQTKKILSHISNIRIQKYCRISFDVIVNHILEFWTCFSYFQIHFLEEKKQHDVLLSFYAPHVHYYNWCIVPSQHFSTKFQHCNRSESMNVNCGTNTSIQNSSKFFKIFEKKKIFKISFFLHFVCFYYFFRPPFICLIIFSFVRTVVHTFEFSLFSFLHRME